MNLAEISIRNRLICSIVILICVLGGWSAYETMPRLEDPDFTIRTAQVITVYPGATPLQVSKEVTKTLETAFNQMPEVEEITSVSSAGRSIINVNVKFEYSRTQGELQTVYTKLRNRVEDATRQLPPGAQKPIVNDDFADVYGLYYALTSDGYSFSDMEKYAESLRDELLLIDGVGKVGIIGVVQEAVFVEFRQTAGLSTDTFIDQIVRQMLEHNSVAQAGEVTFDNKRLVVQLPATEETIEALNQIIVSVGGKGRLVRLQDLADIRRGYVDPPSRLIRHNGEPALGIGVSVISTENIVRVGELVASRIAELEVQRPVGLEVKPYYNQGEIVEAAVEDFSLSVVAAIVIVLVTLTIFMGIRSGLVIGGLLVLTISATLLVMQLWGVPMHRISLGALIIALGMLTDNGIVVADGILVGVRAGRSKLDIAKEVVSRSKWPLLGGTMVGIIAFAPIGFAPGAAAEYTGDLFRVVLISLLLSWIFALTLVPLLADWFLKEVSDPTSETQEGFIAKHFKRVVSLLLKFRWVVVLLAIGSLGLAIYGMQFVKPGFFPSATTPQVVIDYRLPEGTSFGRTDADMREIENHLISLQGVEHVHALVGGGTLRFMLIYNAENSSTSYGQILVRLDSLDRIEPFISETQSYINMNFPDSQSAVWQFKLGPGGGPQIEVEFSGKDPTVLRTLADQAKSVMTDSNNTVSTKDDWRQRVATVVPNLNESRMRRLGISREDVARAMQVSMGGRTVGIFREKGKLVPIIHRRANRDRNELDDMGSIPVFSQTLGRTIQLRQLVDGFNTEWRDALFRRVDGIWSIRAQTDPAAGLITGEVEREIKPSIEAIDLPPGYTLEWRGESGASAKANESLAKTLPIGFAAMVLTVVFLFNSIRQPLLIFLTLPLALVGVTAGLLIFDTPLEFMAILGVLSLSGLMIKNVIVLVDQMDFEISQGNPRFQAIIDSTASRLRPVAMGAITTILGVLPLLNDAFFRSMAVVIIVGLIFATILTLLVSPVLYAIFFNVKATEV